MFGIFDFFLVGAGNCKAATLGGGECRCDIGVGVSAGIGKLLGGLPSDETSRFTFEGSLVRNARFADLTCEFWRQARTKR